MGASADPVARFGGEGAEFGVVRAVFDPLGEFKGPRGASRGCFPMLGWWQDALCVGACPGLVGVGFVGVGMLACWPLGGSIVASWKELGLQPSLRGLGS